MSTPRIALVTVAAARTLDEDLAPLASALREAAVDVAIVDWDDTGFDWSGVDAAVLRSPWDYTDRPGEFLAWAARTAARTRLLNPPDVLRWNTDKHYLADLAARGVSVVPSAFVEPEADPLPALQAFLAEYAEADEFVVKPAISAGSRDTQRYARTQEFAAANHIARLLDAGRSVLLQPYLASVDRDGETALLYFDGDYSHAIRKGALLRPDAGATEALFAPEQIVAREPGDDERALAQTVLAAARDALKLDAALAYARVDLIRDGNGLPRLLELELCEPSLFLPYADGSADRFVAGLLARLTATP